jgi:hypothetical protein
MSRSELIDLARKMGVVNFRMKTSDGTKNATKSVICERIRKATGQKIATFRNTNKNKNVKLGGTGEKTFKVGSRVCTTMNKNELLRVAKILKIKLPEKVTIKEICKEIEKVRNNLTKPKPPPPPKPTKREIQKVKKEKVQNQKIQQRVKRVGLDDNSIRKDLEKQYGKPWMNRYKPNLNQDVRNIKNAVSKVGSNNRNKALGVPKKMVVDKIKKDMVRNWKMQRKRNLERNFVMKNVNVTGVPNNMKNRWRRTAADEALRRNKIMTAKQFAVLKKKWLKAVSNINKNGNARRTVGAARARVETL